MAKRMDVTYCNLKADVAYQLVKGDITWNELKATQVDLNYYTLNRYLGPDSFSFSDISSLNIGKVSAETLSISDSQQLSLQKQISEALSLSENVDIVVQFFRDFSDSYAVSDVAVLTIGKGLTETLSISEILSNAFSTVKTDSTPISDTDSKSLSKPLADSLSVGDIFNRNVSYTRAFTDAFSLDDIENHINGAVVNKTNVFSFSDNSVFSVQKNAADSVSLSENFSHLVTRHNHSVLNTSSFNTFALNS